MNVKSVEMQRLVSELRELQSAVQKANVDETVTTEAGSTPQFATLLAETVNSVNDKMMHAQQTADAFIREEPGASLVEAMVAMNQAQVSFRYVVEVRNRLIQAYQDIANMPV